MRSTSERLQVVSAKISERERAFLVALASMAGASVSAALRGLVREAARDRLREVAPANPQEKVAR